MERAEAWRLLGLEDASDRATVRSAYLARLHDVHPDHSPAPDAHDLTVRLSAAYRVALAEIEGVGDAPRPPRVAPPDPPQPVVPVAQLDDDTIGIGAPPDETWRIVTDAAQRLGEISFVDGSAGLMQVIVEFVDEPVCQLVLTLQGRATGVTEVFVNVESLDASAPPPIDAVTRLLVATLTG